MVRRIKIFLLLGISFCVSGQIWGQSGPANSIYQTLTTNNTSGSFTSAFVTNVGQISHQVLISFSTNGGVACSNPQVTSILLEGGYTNTSTPVLIGNAIGTTNNTLTFTIQGSGAYPYVNLHVTWVDNINCAMTANYTGMLPPVQVMGTGLYQAGSGIIGINGIQPIIAGGLATNGIGTQVGIAVPQIFCTKTVPISVAAAATQQIISVATGITGYICGASLVTDTAATGVTIFEGTGATCGTGSSNLATWTGLVAGSTINLSVGPYPAIRTQTVGDGLCISAVTGKVSGFVSVGTLSYTGAIF